jgi:AcrR family transcriptional regulator
MSTAMRTGDSVPSPNGGRPRDSRIDDAVMVATRALLEEVGYLRLSIAAVAERAGTNKPAIYRRWPTKAHLVHAAVFPAAEGVEMLPAGADLRGDIRALVELGVEVLSQPATRAALPGLIAEMTDDPALHADVLDRFATASWGWLQARIEAAITAGEVRTQIASSTVLEIIAGSTFVATAIRPSEELDADWVDRVVDVIMRGIAP